MARRAGYWGLRPDLSRHVAMIDASHEHTGPLAGVRGGAGRIPGKPCAAPRAQGRVRRGPASTRLTQDTKGEELCPGAKPYRTTGGGGGGGGADPDGIQAQN